MAKKNLLARRPDSLSECAGWRADIDRARAIVADRIAETVDKKWGTAVAAERETGVSQTEFSRIRHGKLERYTSIGSCSFCTSLMKTLKFVST